MAEYKAEETLVIEVGSEYVTKSKPFKVKAKLSESFEIVKSFKKIVIGKGIVEVGGDAFSRCGSLCEIDLAEVKEIGDRAFERCSALTSFTLPTGITKIGDGTFYACTGRRLAKANAHLQELTHIEGKNVCFYF